MEKQEAYQLLDKYLTDKLSASEAERLKFLLQQSTNDPAFEDVLLELASLQDKDPDYVSARWSSMITAIAQPEPRVRKLPVRWMAAAAIAAAVITLLFTWNQFNRSVREPSAVVQQDPAPGGEKAILTLADGTRVELDSSGNATLQQGGAAVIQNGGELTYEGREDEMGQVFNLLSTPRGGQFRIVLPDGTRVWLNAASSLKYPTVFNGPERRVELTGEGYFEVTADEQHPFLVGLSGGNEVKVVGTKFNINAYTNETAIKATLLHGIISVANTVMKPDQQASITPGGAVQIKSNVDVQAAVAWKNGAFNLEGASLREVMRQLERWYDIDVTYEGNVPDVYFSGKISRTVKLSAVLKALKEWGVNFRMEDGKRLVVLP